jgi:hypothetical protein
VRQGHPRREEADLAVLVFDVDLERVQPVLGERQVLRDLPLEGGERHGHVDTTDLRRKQHGLGPRGRLLRRSARSAGWGGWSRGALGGPAPERAHAERESGGRDGHDAERAETPEGEPAAGATPPFAETFVRVEAGVEVHGAGTLRPSGALRN